MFVAQRTKEKIKPNAVIVLLNQLLANTIDLKLCAKQAHWNIKGGNFIALHELFDKVSGKVDEYADLIAERAVQLGGTAEGTLQAVSGESTLSPYPVDIHESQDHVRALGATIGMLADVHRQAVNTTTNAGDMVTADVLVEITRGLDKLHWFVRSHENGD